MHSREVQNDRPRGKLLTYCVIVSGKDTGPATINAVPQGHMPSRRYGDVKALKTCLTDRPIRYGHVLKSAPFAHDT